MKNKKLLAVGAHPDDVEFMCSGTLKLLKQRGYETHICIVANGDCGSMIEPREIITKTRREEAINAANLLDGKVYFLNEYDLKIQLNNKTKMKVTENIRFVDPLIVFTHPHEDYMIDHEITSVLVRAACFAAPISNFNTSFESPQTSILRIPYLYYWAPMMGTDIRGDFVDQRMYVNVSKVIDFKKDMLACHKSQRDLLRNLQSMDNYIETMLSMAKKYGEKCGFEYAEGFTQHLGNAYPQDNLLMEILNDLMVEKNRRR